MRSCRGNPYLKEFNKLSGDDQWYKRMRLARKYAWAIPDTAAITRLASLSPIVEIGAGAGYWACLLKQAGASVVAFDPEPPGGDNKYLSVDEAYFPVRRGGVEVLSKYPKHTLFICWPPMTPWAGEALRLFKGEHFVYIGEGWGGCTADNSLFSQLGEGDESNKKPTWERVDTVEIPQWAGIHDEMVVYKRIR